MAETTNAMGTVKKKEDDDPLLADQSDGKPIYFQLYIIKPWLFGLYFRGNFGWKLWGYPMTKKMQFTFSPNPFRKV